MEFCPQYCARIATEIYDKWRVLSWLLTAFGVHKVLSRKCPTDLNSILFDRMICIYRVSHCEMVILNVQKKIEDNSTVVIK